MVLLRILILYFSGTGNTDFVGKYLYRKLESLSVDFDLHISSIENMLPERTNEFDLLIIGFPVYAGAPPEFFVRYINGMPAAAQKGVFVFCTRAMFVGHAIKDIYIQMEAKGYIPLGYAIIGMPGSDGLPFMSQNSKYVQRALSKDYNELREINRLAERINRAIGQINQGTSVITMRSIAPKGIPLLNQLFQLLWNIGYKFAEKKIKLRFRVEGEKCVRCGLCIKQCPAKNISLKNGSIIFDTRCYLCMRCINQCPKEAVQIGKWTINKFRWKGPNGDFRHELNSLNRSRNGRFG
jgi:ferredoxin/flavodoxin